MTRSGRIFCAVAGLLALALAGCQTSPITGRSQLILLSDSAANKLGVDAYKEILKNSKVSKNREMNRRVRTVGQRIAAVSNAPGFDWEFKVIEDDSPNAFALPGGKVGVHTGLFKVAMTTTSWPPSWPTRWAMPWRAIRPNACRARS